MDSVPKDGTEVLLAVRGQVKLAVWFEPWGVWVESHDMPIKDVDGEITGIGALLPTAWMYPPKVDV